MRAVPGGPFASEKAITPAAQAALEAKYGLDKPLMEQYFTYLKDIVTDFNFGPSLKQRGRDVIEIISEGLSVSAKLGIAAAIIALSVGIYFGSVAAINRNRLYDKIIISYRARVVKSKTVIITILTTQREFFSNKQPIKQRFNAYFFKKKVRL